MWASNSETAVDICLQNGVPLHLPIRQRAEDVTAGPRRDAIRGNGLYEASGLVVDADGDGKARSQLWKVAKVKE
jgi:hypothetical protein